MTYEQRQQHRELYQQLRMAITFPGDSAGDYRKPYMPVNKDNWTFDYAMLQPDTPDIAARRNVRQTSFLVRLGRHRQAVAK